MARKTDSVTRWWRGISLRAKITGVTVALLAIGLFAAGIGTMAFLRTALIANLETQLVQVVSTDQAKPLFNITVADGKATFTERDDTSPSDYFVALYAPTGELVASGGGRGTPPPDYPIPMNLQDTVIRGTAPFDLHNSTTDASYRASTDVLPIDGIADQYTQLIALPLASVDRVVTSFLSIYGVISIIIIIGGALATRALVTLAFRNLGQVETTAMSIAAGDFSQRMTEIEPGTEVGRLKIAINTMLGRIDGALSDRDATVRQMRRFIGDASHELRTPLVTVRGYAELYRMGAITTDDDVAQAMERIEKEAMRMGVLVEDLLALARLDERRDVVIGPVDLRPVARDAAMDVRAASPQRPITVVDTTIDIVEDEASAIDALDDGEPAVEGGKRRSAPNTSAIARAGAGLSMLRRKPRPVPAVPAVPAPGSAPLPVVSPIDHSPAPATASGAAPIVLGDENRIRQVVTNLLGNARRFTNEDSPIELSIGIDATAHAGWIEVIDHGEGIPEQIRDKIFQRFWRADTSRTRETGGTGLGLSIVASIVEALHGSVDVIETPGGGATFRVAFPLADQTDAAQHLLIDTQPLTRLLIEP